MSWAFRITNNLEDKEKAMSFAAASKEERKVRLYAHLKISADNFRGSLTTLPEIIIRFFIY